MYGCDEGAEQSGQVKDGKMIRLSYDVGVEYWEYHGQQEEQSQKFR